MNPPTSSQALLQRAGLSTSWRHALPALVVVLLGIVLLYRGTATAMVGIWWRSETFAHAFIVPPISLWLIWRQRELLAAMTPRPQPWVLLPMVLMALFWLAGDLVVVNAATQLALVALLVLAVPLVLGTRVAGAIAFPLVFLFFAVPIGEFLLPVLMEGTADFTVAALTLSGIPVYREGLQFVIPSGNWSVVEACSGVRYLIASLMVGTLFAYLNYSSTWRRVVFIGISIVVPILANWLRAYMIVMLGHLSDNKLAVGVDHLIYGWVFFGVVIMLMFMIGARWSEPEATAKELVAALPPLDGAALASTARWVFIAAAGVATVAMSLLAKGWLDRDAQAAAAPKLTLPASLGPDWVGSDSTITDWVPRFEQPAAQAQRSYASASGTVGVHIAYYRAQTYESKLVNSENTLVPSEDKVWNRTSARAPEIDVEGHALRMLASRLQGSPNLTQSSQAQLLVWQTYWSDGALTTSDYRAKLAMAVSRLRGRGDDGASIVLYVKSDDDQRGSELLARFTREQMPALLRMLRETRAQR